jgi:hypothetical protein
MSSAIGSTEFPHVTAKQDADSGNPATLFSESVTELNGEEARVYVYWHRPEDGEPYLVIEADIPEGIKAKAVVNDGTVWDGRQS